MNENETLASLPWVMSSLFRRDEGHSSHGMARQPFVHSESDEDTTLFTIVSDHGITSIQQDSCLRIHTHRHTQTRNQTHTNNNWLATLTKDWKLSPFFPRSSCPLVHWFRNQVKKDIKSRLGKKKKTSFLRNGYEQAERQQTSMFYCLSPCSNWKNGWDVESLWEKRKPQPSVGLHRTTENERGHVLYHQNVSAPR